MFSTKKVTLQPGSTCRPRAWQSDALSTVPLRLMYRVTKWSKLKLRRKRKSDHDFLPAFMWTENKDKNKRKFVMNLIQSLKSMISIGYLE